MTYTKLLLLAGMLLLGSVVQSRANLSEYFFSQESNGAPTDMTGATLALAGGNDDVTAGSFPIGFTFNLDGTNYTTFTVSSNGWMKLGTHTTNSNLGNNLTGGEYPVLAGFWDDLRTNNTGGYIQYKLEGSPGSQVLTVEWNTTYWSAPTSGPWIWQIRLYETGIIEYLYVSMPSNFNTSATIGLAVSGSNFISVTPTNPATTSNTVSNNAIDLNVTPIAPGTLYTFSRVLNDLACTEVTFTGANEVNGFPRNTAVTVNAEITNLGSIPKTNIPVRFDVYYNGRTRVYTSENGTVSPGNRLGTATYTFSPIPAAVNSSAGVYMVHVYAVNPVDENRRNDTCKIPYFVLGTNDVVPFQVLSPFENAPPLFSKYPVDYGVPIEIRFLNVGTRDQENVDVGYKIFRQGETQPIYQDNSITIPGTFRSGTYRDINLPNWTPTEPGTYCLQVYTNLDIDEDRSNDTLPSDIGGFCFVVAYETEVMAVSAGRTEQRGDYPVGRPIYMEAIFQNNGLNDATNSSATMTVRDPGGAVVYQQTVSVLDIPADGGRTAQRFPDFVPPVASGAGRYCVDITINNPNDPVASNNSYSFCFNVLPPLRGEYQIGFGQRFRTIQDARDALFYLGVSGPVDFVLIDPEYTVTPPKIDDPQLPALDFRGDIIGAGSNATITWRVHSSVQQATVRLESPSGIGIWFGQQDTLNPNGYMIFDGGTGHKLHFVLENMLDVNDLAIPFMFGRGASNYTVRNCIIEGVDPRSCVSTVTLPSYDAGFNRFTYITDVEQQVSAGIMLRNTMPFNAVTRQNNLNADTLYNQNNLFEKNEIRGFAYGILSVGAGPVFRTQTARFDEITNRSNVYRQNLIESVGRGGIAVTYETNSQIVENRIRGVANNCGQGALGSSAAGIWVTAGGTNSNDRGYSSDLLIARNQVSNVQAARGVGAAILVDNNRNVMITPANVVQEFPSASNMKVQNNMVWNYMGAGQTMGIGFRVPTAVELEYTPRGNRILNNTIYNSNASVGTESGIAVEYTQATVMNNIVAVLNTDAAALGYRRVRAPQNELDSFSITSDYNLLWAPNGLIGAISRVSPEGFPLPSPPNALTLSQWQYLTGMDDNSVTGNIVPEFVSTTVGAENLHINPLNGRSLAGNRGIKLADVTNDIDNEPRGAAAINGQYDIGADEFWGVVRNNDIMADDVVEPFGFRARNGDFSDAEYIMTDSTVDLGIRLRNIGGRPVANASVTLEVQHWTGSAWVSDMSSTRITPVDVSETSVVSFGTFQPRTLQQFNMTDARFGTMAPNVTPLYRLVVTTGNDDNLANNRFEKVVRFYVQRSSTEAMISVEDYAPAGTALPTGVVALGNRLNADSMLAGMAQIGWSRTGTVNGNATFNFDLFERDRWPQYALNFKPWQLMMWTQGEEAGGLKPEEREALKAQQDAWNEFRPAGLFITGQEVARKHDVVLDATNGDLADQEFVRNYLRAEYRGNTNPALYDNLRIQGIRITPGRFEMVKSTGVNRDAGPMPSVVRATGGEGIAQGTHWFVDHNQAGAVTRDSLSGMTVATRNRASVYYAIDIRHFGRFAPEANRSGVQRVILGAIDFLNQYGTVLPVDLISLEGRQTGREAVTVTWETASEKDITALELERAEVLTTEAGEKIGGFRVIAERAPEGSSDRGATYRVLDEDVRSGREYVYQLVSIEKDGSRQTVENVRVAVSTSANGAYSLEVRPNPITDRGSIAWRAPRGEEVMVRIVDSRGVEVRNVGAVSNGEGEITISVQDLPSGLYIVELQGAGGQVLREKLQIRK